ncbi:ankyrin repeat domain-containing protein [Spongiimicrobium sp. 2-473A-2-J]|uniref:ankyrin repeat domain-containing protein n=1 Tax=Eudoraea algarum TaxID=3417568 RepID=UPI003D36C0E6
MDTKLQSKFQKRLDHAVNDQKALSDLIEEWLEMDGTYEHIFEDGTSFLSYLIMAGNPKQLQEAKEQVKDWKGPLGLKALNTAIREDNSSLVHYLLREGVDPKETNEYFPLMRAAVKNNKEVVQALLNAGAHVDQSDEASGWTALMWAVRLERAAMVAFLIENQASLEQKNQKGETALQIAYRTLEEYQGKSMIGQDFAEKRKRCLEIIDILTGAGASVPQELETHLATIDRKEDAGTLAPPPKPVYTGYTIVWWRVVGVLVLFFIFVRSLRPRAELNNYEPSDATKIGLVLLAIALALLAGYKRTIRPSGGENKKSDNPTPGE